MTLSDKIRSSSRVYIIGNGGSYANSSHIVNDLLSKGVKAYCMDTATLTAFANDYGYEEVFSRWINIVGEPSDLLIVLSGSGKSKNILKAVATAKNMGMTVWEEFGAAKGLNMQEAEEAQLKIGHDYLCG